VNALLLAALLCTGFDFGGRVAGLYPVGDLNRYHASSALLGAAAGWTTGPFRFEAGYSYASLPGRQATPYRLSFHLPHAGIGWSPVRQPGWGLELGAGGGYALGRRDFGSGTETGNAALAELGFSFIQLAGKSRLAVGFWYSNLIENSPAAGVRLSPLLSLRAGVSYVP
jgi:hypothetical protein